MNLNPSGGGGTSSSNGESTMSWGPVIGGAIGAIGGIIGNQANADASRVSGEKSLEIAHLNNNFQKYMSNTAHQRQVEDLKAAGLNPLMSLNTGASTPSGSSAQFPVAHQENVLAGMGEAITSAIQLRQQAQAMKADIAKKEQEIEVGKQSIQESRARQENYNQDSELKKKQMNREELYSKVYGSILSTGKAAAEVNPFKPNKPDSHYKYAPVGPKY